MTTYAATFPPGLSQPVGGLLQTRISGTNISALYDGFCVFESCGTPEEISLEPYLNNAFIVLSRYQKDVDFERMSLLASRDKNALATIQKHVTPPGGFRVMYYDRNQPTGVRENSRVMIEKAVTKECGLVCNRSKPDCELWFLRRSEDVSFFLLRLTHRGNMEKRYQKGELHRELAFTLCHLADIAPEHIVSDPFCGYGAIPRECLRSFPCKKVAASDINGDMIDLCRKYIRKKSGTHLDIRKVDVFDSDFCVKNSVDRIITDPPWGEYSQLPCGIEEFYTRMLERFSYILRPGGRLVLLSGRNELVPEILNKSDKFILVSRYPILLSGRKSEIFVCDRQQ